MRTQLDMIRELVQTAEAAIRFHHWKADSDTKALLREAVEMLETAGYRRDGITGREFVLA